MICAVHPCVSYACALGDGVWEPSVEPCVEPLLAFEWFLGRGGNSVRDSLVDSCVFYPPHQAAFGVPIIFYFTFYKV